MFTWFRVRNHKGRARTQADTCQLLTMPVIVIFKEAEPMFGWIMFCGLFVLDAELAVVCACVVMPIFI